jgi:DegV family protein with EDD domain
MAAGVAIVTDSSASLPDDVLAEHGVLVVPLAVHEEAGEGRVMTSRPSPELFRQAYEAAAGSGALAVTSIHLSGEMSGTIDGARLAARDAPIPVTVIDSRSIGMGLGFAVTAAARAAAAGAAVKDVADAAMRRIRETRSLFYVDTLEHLRRGGRIGAAAPLLGPTLVSRPLLHIAGGRVAPLEKVRTSSRALTRLTELAVEFAGDRSVDMAVQHVAASQRAALLAAHLRERAGRLRELLVAEAGPVVAAHVGPGMLGVVVARRERR